MANQCHQPFWLDILITVKTYPSPSTRLDKAACIAGISQERGPIRLHPVPFRKLEVGWPFKKYQWVQVQVSPSSNDRRPETYRPHLETLQSTVEKPLTRQDLWQERRDLILPFATTSFCDLQEAQEREGRSLSLFKPAEVLDFEWEEEHPSWTPEELAGLKDRDLFMTRDGKLLEKIPFGFWYCFWCEGCRAKEPHHLKVVDWELAQQYRKLRRQGKSTKGCLQKLKTHWLEKLCGHDRETYFFTGNMLSHPGVFRVLGVFWPPYRHTSHRV